MITDFVSKIKHYSADFFTLFYHFRLTAEKVGSIIVSGGDYMKTKYEQLPHGTDKFPVAIFSEVTYGAPPHHHREYEILYLAKGRMRFGIDNYEHMISEGDVVFIEPYTSHTFGSDGEDFHYYALLFDPSILGGKDDPARETFESVRFNRYVSLSGDILTKIPALFKADSEKAFGREILMKLFIYSIINHLIATHQFSVVSDLKPVQDNCSQAVFAAAEYIGLNYREQIKIQDIISLVKYSQSHFMRVFKRETGYSITEYINRIRVERACLDLMYSKKSLTDIAIGNGFSTPQYFSKVFTCVMSITPSQFRNRAKSLAAPPIEL